MGESAVKAFLADMARKHLPGQHNQDSHGNDHGGIDVPNPLDKLKLGKRAPAGFRVRSSKKLKSEYAADVGIAEVDGPDGPHFRVGIITSESGKWDAGFTGEARRAELRKQIAEKQALFDSDDEQPDDLEDELSDLKGELEELENERTAIVSPETMADFRRKLGDALTVAKANKTKQDADTKAQEDIDEQRDRITAEFSDAALEREISRVRGALRSDEYRLRLLRQDPDWAHAIPGAEADVAEAERRLAPLLARRAEMLPPDARARLEDLDRQYFALIDENIDDMLTSTEVAAPNGSRIRAEIWGSDDVDEDWVKTLLYVLAPGETTDDADNGSEYGRFGGIKGLTKLIAGLESSGDLPKSSRRDTQNKHLPGRHDQSSHGRGRRRTPDVDVPDVPKPEPVAEPKPPKPRRAPKPKPKPPSEAPKPNPPQASPEPARRSDAEINQEIKEIAREMRDVENRARGPIATIARLDKKASTRGLQPADSRAYEQAEVELEQLVREGVFLANTHLDLLVERDGQPFGGDAPQMPTASPRASWVAGANQDAARRARSEYVMNDKLTIASNASLRSGNPTPEARKWRARMAQMTQSQRIGNDSVVYRGAVFKPDTIMKLQPGSVLHDVGTTSTDTTRENAKFYGQRRGLKRPGLLPTLFAIRVPSGTHGYDADDDEFVFGPDSSMRILSSRRTDQGIEVTAEMLAPGQG